MNQPDTTRKPARRDFLRLGGATIALSAVVAACGSDDGEQLPVTGTAPPTDDESTSTASPEMDITLLRTQQSIEVLAAQTYRTVIDEGLLTTPALLEAMERFQGQHEERAQLLGEAATEAGGEPYPDPNPFLATTVDEQVEVLSDEEATVALALELEAIATQTCVYASELFTTPELRQTIMSVGGAEARAISVLYGVQGQPQVPFAFMPRRNRIDDQGLITSDTEG
jgi:hypothetical protein